MKKSSLAVLLPALALTGLLLSGCGMFRSHKAWDTAKQESPLEIPPGLDTPSASAALVIPPPGANNPTANGVSAGVNGKAAMITDGFVLSDTVENSYHRVSQTLEAGDIGQVQSHDDAAHSFALTVNAAPVVEVKHGLFGRMLGRGKTSSKETGPVTAHDVQLTVNSSGQNASEIRAQGDPAAVAKVIDALKARLGG